MKLFFLFFIIFVNISLINGLLISPTKIEYNIKTGEKMCKIITLGNQEQINVQGHDVWTNNPNKKKKLGEYNKMASEFEINVEYEKEINNLNSEEVEVCVSGVNPGNYYGALVYNAEAKGGVSAGVGTWLMVSISDKQGNIPAYSGSDDSETNILTENKNVNSTKNTNNLKNNNTDDSLVVVNPSITGNVIGFGKSNWKIIVTTLVAIVAAYVALFIINKKRKEKEYGVRIYRV